MKKLPLILSVISLVAVVALYVLYFTSGKKNGHAKSEGTTENASITASEIVYIDIDTLLNNYKMYLDYKGEFERKAKLSEAELTAKQKTYQKGVNDYQYKVQRGLVTRAEAQQLEQQLMVQQQDLLKLQQDKQVELAEQEQVMIDLVLKSVTDYLKEIQPEYNYKYVFANRLNNGSIYYGSQELDITKNIIKGLNEKYSRIQESQKKK